MSPAGRSGITICNCSLMLTAPSETSSLLCSLCFYLVVLTPNQYWKCQSRRHGRRPAPFLERVFASARRVLHILRVLRSTKQPFPLQDQAVNLPLRGHGCLGNCNLCDGSGAQCRCSYGCSLRARYARSRFCSWRLPVAIMLVQARRAGSTLLDLLLRRRAIGGVWRYCERSNNGQPPQCERHRRMALAVCELSP